MKPITVWSIALLVASGAGGGAYLFLSETPPVASEVVVSAAHPKVAETEPPKVRYPIQPRAADPTAVETKKTASTTPTKTPPPQPPVNALPRLDASDLAVIEKLGKIVELERLERLFNIENFVRRIVVTIDNLPRRQVPPRYYPVTPITGKFQALGEEGKQTLSEKNYRRYEDYVTLIETVDVNTAVAVYAFLYPLFQEAYEDLGYPDAYFNDRLVEAIDDLIASPELAGPVKLVRPSVMFKYADPELERLSAGQKIMIRMGSGNANRVKIRLVQFRREITRSERVAGRDDLERAN